MLSIVAIVTLALALIAFSVVRRREARFAKANQGVIQRSSIAALAMPIIYVPILLIATRFGARAFPGIWTPNNPLLNEITQGGIFYIAAAAAIICGVIDLFLAIVSSSTAGILSFSLVWGKCVLLAGVVAVCLYGFIVAIYLQRLP